MGQAEERHVFSINMWQAAYLTLKQDNNNIVCLQSMNLDSLVLAQR